MTKKERLDSLEANLNFMAQCMEQLLEQQKKQIEQTTIEEVEVEPQLEEPIDIKSMIENYASKITDKMQREKLTRDKVIELIENLGGFKKIDCHRFGENAWGVYFILEPTNNVVKFRIDLELNSCKAYLLY